MHLSPVPGGALELFTVLQESSVSSVFLVLLRELFDFLLP